MPNFYLIGLTGNLGSGKSTVRRMLEELGAQGIDADQLGHVAMLRGTPAWSAIVDAFGTEIVHANGKIDRQVLASRVFNNPGELRRLENILHPAVGELIKENLRSTSASVVVLEAIKLFEANLHAYCDAVWVVTASPDVQIQRVMRDRSMRLEDARTRLAQQSPIEEKTKLANIAIDNSFDLNSTRTQVLNAWRKTVHPEQARDKSEWLFSRPSTALPNRQEPPAPVPPNPPSSPPVESKPDVAPEGLSPFEEPAPDQAIHEELLPPAPRIGELENQPTEALDVPEAAAAPEQLTAQVTPPAPLPVPERLQSEQPVPVPSEPAMREPTAPVTPPAPNQPEARAIGKIEVRRARRSDIDALGVALGKLENRPEPLQRADLLKRSGERGYRIAVCEGTIVALAAWEAENLVAITRELWAESAAAASRALPPLFGLVEQDARELQCEASVILINPRTPDYILELVRAANYQPRPIGTLNRIWKQVAEERSQPGDSIWVKRLRDDLVTKPI